MPIKEFWETVTCVGQVNFRTKNKGSVSPERGVSHGSWQNAWNERQTQIVMLRSVNITWGQVFFFKKTCVAPTRHRDRIRKDVVVPQEGIFREPCRRSLFVNDFGHAKTPSNLSLEYLRRYFTHPAGRNRRIVCLEASWRSVWIGRREKLMCSFQL